MFFRISSRAVVLLLFLCVSVQIHARELGLIPIPNAVTEHPGEFSSQGCVSVYASKGVSDFNVGVLDSLLKGELQVSVVEIASYSDADAVLFIDSSMKREDYELVVSRERILLTAGSNAGVYYGLMTLSQIMASRDSKAIECVEISDSPHYGYRALMIDPARHFLPIDDVKRFVDLMSRFKYNVLQLHLTDDQGWRVEIVSHPELTQGQEHYTQEQLRDLIAYAADRNVEIVPEIDVPGHTAAFLYSHPELMCSHNDTLKIDLGQTVNLMLCASKPEVYRIYDDIIGELASLFPSNMIHLGGDESAIDANWGKCVNDSVLVERLGLESPVELMGYFFDNIFKSVRKNGKQAMMWCELDNIYMPAYEYLFDYPQDVTLVTWRNGLTPRCIELTEQSGNRLIMAPGEYAYLDYPQYKNDLPEFNNWGMPVTTLEAVYEFDPEYGAEHPMVSGVMGTLWAEAMPDINRVTYMAFPRALALSEAGWSRLERRNWDSFKRRLIPVLSSLMKMGVSYRVPFEIYK